MMEIRQIRVLLIEDNPDDAFLVKEFCTQYPYAKFHITIADRLSKAQIYLEREFFDAILLDLNLPDSHGSETILRAHLHSYNVPIIVLTGNRDKHLIEGATERGVATYLIKGAAGKDLAQSIHEVVSQRWVAGEN